MTDIAIDTEFREDGKRIDLISIGLVRDDGSEYYAVNADAYWPAIGRHEWLCQNVVPHLPLVDNGQYHGITRIEVGEPLFIFRIDVKHPAVRRRREIADEVRDFILDTPDPQLWAWYAAYDHVALAQLWGRMIDLPDGVPMWTNDLRQETQRLGNPRLPKLPGAAEHNALDDAREVMYRRRWLRDYEAARTSEMTRAADSGPRG